METKTLWGVGEIGALFNVNGQTVDVWRRRYSGDLAFPKPDVTIGSVRPIAGWDPSREAEIRAWHASRPGSGAGGGRPRKTATPAG